MVPLESILFSPVYFHREMLEKLEIWTPEVAYEEPSFLDS